MLAKKIWIPVLLVLIGFAIGGTFVGRHIASQEPVRVINVVTPEPVDRSQPTQAETQPAAAAEGGHWHGDEWHADPHEPSDVIPEPMRDTPEFLSAERLLDLPAETLSDVLVKSYVDEHFEAYPDCQEHESVLADARREADFYFADTQWFEERQAASAEFKRLGEELDRYTEKSRNFDYERMSAQEKQEKAAYLEDWQKRYDTAFEKTREISRQNPVHPKRMHTH